MPKKMRLEYEYDAHTAAVVVTQPEPCSRRAAAWLPHLSWPQTPHQPLPENSCADPAVSNRPRMLQRAAGLWVPAHGGTALSQQHWDLH